MKPIRVLFVRNCRGIINLTGAEVYLLTLLNGFDHDEYETHTICTIDPRNGDTPWLEELRNSGVSHSETSVSHAWSVRDLIDVIATIRRFRPDIVHSFDHRSDLVAIAAAKLLRTAAVASFFGWTNWTSNDRKGNLYERIDRKVLRFADAVIVDSSAMADLLGFRETATRIEVIPNGLDTDRFNLQHVETLLTNSLFDIPEPIIIGMLARYHPVKGQLTLLKAAAELARSRPACRFLLIGDVMPGYEDYRAEMVRFISEHGLEQIVMLVNAVHEEVPAMLAGIDIFAAPSLKESFSYSLLAAMAMQRPVITTSVGGNLEIITDRENGMFIPPDDWQALASAIETLIDDPVRRSRLGKSARQTIENNWSLDIMLTRTQRVYKQVLEARNNGR